MLVTEFCSKGALQDILENADIKLDTMFVSSLTNDLVKGMLFLHSSELGCHGNLRSSNCVVTSRWTLQITDFGLHELRSAAELADVEEGISEWDDASYTLDKLLWKAPEILRSDKGSQRGTQKGILALTHSGESNFL